MRWLVIALLLLLGYLVRVADSHAAYTGLTQIRFANAWCESSGNIHAIGYRGMYRGKWQFDWPTWRAYAPRGWKGVDPAWAPEWVQDRAALNACAMGRDLWPNC